MLRLAALVIVYAVHLYNITDIKRELSCDINFVRISIVQLVLASLNKAKKLSTPGMHTVTTHDSIYVL